MTKEQKARTITKSEYYQLVGLLTLCRGHLKQIEFIRTALYTITKEQDEWGHTGDVVWDKDSDAGDFLKKLNICVRGKP